jgi:hypothetical protein
MLSIAVRIAANLVTPSQLAASKSTFGGARCSVEIASELTRNRIMKSIPTGNRRSAKSRRRFGRENALRQLRSGYYRVLLLQQQLLPLRESWASM